MLKVIYQGKRFEADIHLRESLFQDLKQSTPNYRVKITGKRPKITLYVNISELTLASMYRHI